MTFTWFFAAVRVRFRCRFRFFLTVVRLCVCFFRDFRFFVVRAGLMVLKERFCLFLVYRKDVDGSFALIFFRVSSMTYIVFFTVIVVRYCRICYGGC